jgi:2-polyprenyl-6-methoxyphenol hydroxylase-like FAD-dependent oxidoreductase
MRPGERAGWHAVRARGGIHAIGWWRWSGSPRSRAPTTGRSSRRVPAAGGTARLPGDRVVAAYFTDPDLLPPDRARHWDRQFGETRLVGGLAAAARDWSAVSVVAASSGRLLRFAGPGWLAIGDASLSYDPCSGQGITKALQSALDAAAAVAADLAGDCGAVEAFAAATAAQFHTFVASRRANYRREQRWPESQFWQRRHAAD